MMTRRFLAFICGLNLACLPAMAWAADLEEIIERGKLIVAVQTDVKPLGFADSQGNLQGLEIDIAKGLAQELLGDAAAIELIPVNNQERLQLLLEGKVDLAIAQITSTSARARLVNFSPYYYLDGTGIITKKPAIGSLSDLRRTTIAILEGSSAIAQIRSELPQAQLVGVKSYREAFHLLESGEVTAFAGDNTVLAGWVQEYPSYRQLKIRLGAYPLAVAMPKGLQYQSLLERVNQTVKSWRDSGWLENKIKEWGLL